MVVSAIGVNLLGAAYLDLLTCTRPFFFALPKLAGLTHLTHHGMMCVMADVPLRISIRNMPSSLWRRLRVLALQRNVTVHHIVISALERYLKEEPK